MKYFLCFYYESTPIITIDIFSVARKGDLTRFFDIKQLFVSCCQLVFNQPVSWKYVFDEN